MISQWIENYSRWTEILQHQCKGNSGQHEEEEENALLWRSVIVFVETCSRESGQIVHFGNRFIERTFHTLFDGIHCEGQENECWEYFLRRSGNIFHQLTGTDQCIDNQEQAIPNTDQCEKLQKVLTQIVGHAMDDGGEEAKWCRRGDYDQWLTREKGKG